MGMGEPGDNIDEVIKILDGLRSAYAQIVPGQEGKTAPGTVAASNNVQGVQQAPTPPVAPQQLTPPAPPVAPRSQPASNGLKPAPAAPLSPPKARSAASAAKFRAANAYNNANR